MEESQPSARAKLLPRDTALKQLFFTPREFVRTYRWYLVILTLGASADVFTTLWNLRAYGTGIEVHIVQRWVSQIVGVEAGVPLAKLGQLMFVLLVAAWWRPWCRWILLGCGCLYALAACSNYFLWIWTPQTTQFNITIRHRAPSLCKKTTKSIKVTIKAKYTYIPKAQKDYFLTCDGRSHRYRAFSSAISVVLTGNRQS